MPRHRRSTAGNGRPSDQSDESSRAELLAHEISQPLMAIQANAEAALRFLESAEPNLAEVREALVDIGQSTRRAAELIQRLRG